MKIAFVLELFYPNIGGVEKLFLSLSKELVKNGHVVKVVTTQYNKELALNEIYEGVEIVRLPLKHRYLFTFFGKSSIINHVKDFDLVHTTSYNAALPAYLAAKKINIPCVITFHEVWTNIWFKLPEFSFLEKWIFKKFEQYILSLKFDSFIAPSNYTANALISSNIKPEIVKRIYNGIDYNEYENLKYNGNNNRIKYAYFGRAGASKGIDLLIEAASIINKDYNAELVLILPKDNIRFRKRLLKQIEKNNINDSVVVIDSLSFEELKKNLLSYSFVVFPSLSEGFCFGAVEAMALGVPIVSSGKGALKEVVSNKYIEMEDYSVDGLINAIKLAIDNKWNTIPLKKFHLANTVVEYMNLYNQILRK